MKVSKLFILILGVFICQTTFANTIYLEYDPACMDRYEYQYKGVNAGFSHIVYHLRLNDQEKVIFEVGIESKIGYETKPNNVRRCQDVSMNERMVREINSGDLQVFIVTKSGNGYNVSPVGISTYAQISTRGIGFSSVDNLFAYDYSQPANGANLAKSGSEAKIFYNGTLSHTCPKKYLFTKTKARAGKNYTELTIIPGIGAIQEKTGFNQTDAESNVLDLVSINGTPIDSYINSYCSRIGNDLASAFYSNRSGSLDSPIFNNTVETTVITGTTSPNTTTTTTNTTTQPADGNCPIYKDLDRNLYIDRSTGQPANTSCGGNTFSNGYMIGENNVVTTTTPAVITHPPVVETNSNTNVVDVDPGPGSYIYCQEVSTHGAHIVQPNETLYGIARQYGLSVNQLKSFNGLSRNVISPCQKLFTRPANEVSPSDTGDMLVAKDGVDNVHTVQRGETLYQLAKKYGYTVDKFKAINGLSSNSLNVGQKLRTSDCNCPTGAIPSSTSTVVNVPRGEVSTYAETGARLIANTDAQKRQIHIVKENETVYSIAKAYGLSVDRIRAINNLEINEVIIPFQRLYVN
ncbi:MAG: LysM repeat protein [Saprospiraceae bacterium]|jgi:LysM repeat protein